MTNDNKTPDEQRKDAAEAEQKRIAQAEEDRKKAQAAEQERRKKAREAPLVPNAEGNVMVEALMGPYRGQRLTMTAADGQAAIDSHWARNPTEAEYEHEQLDEQHRQEAWNAAHAWAKTQWDAAQGVEPPEPPPPEGGDGGAAARKQRAMTPEEQQPGYKTRGR